MANISIMGRVKGRVSASGLKQALKKIGIRHPVFASRVETDENNTAWFRTDHVPPIPLRVAVRESEDQWRDEIRYEQGRPFSPSRGPLARCVLIRSEDLCDIFIFAQHAICDGTGLAFLFRDLLSFLGSPEREAVPLPEPPLLIPENLPKGVSENPVKRWIRRIYSRQLNKRWQKDPFRFDREDFLALNRAFTNQFTYKIATQALDREQTGKLIACCRRHHCSVNSSLATAYIAGYHDVLGPFTGSRQRVAVPVDMRKRLERPAGEVACLFVGTVMFKFAYRQDRDFWSNVRVFQEIAHRRMAALDCFEVMFQMEDIDPGLMDVLLGFGTMAGYVPRGEKRYDKLSSFAGNKKNAANKLAKHFLAALPGTIITNLADLNFPETYGPLILERLFFAPATGPDYPLVMGVVTTGGRLTLTLNYFEETAASDAMAAVIDRAEQYLELAV